MYAGWKNKLFIFSSNFYISKVDKKLFIAIIQPCQRAKRSANSSDKAISAYRFGKISIGVSVKNKFFTHEHSSCCKYCASGPKFAGCEKGMVI